MKKYQLDREKQPELKDGEINRHKDFKRLRASYERIVKRPRRPFYKDPKAFLGLLLIILILWLLMLETGKEEKQKEQETTTDTTLVAE